VATAPASSRAQTIVGTASSSGMPWRIQTRTAQMSANGWSRIVWRLSPAPPQDLNVEFLEVARGRLLAHRGSGAIPTRRILDLDDELPFTEAQATIEKCIEMLAGRPRHCGRSAFRHLRKAWMLYPIDREMALFRAITAEEEAATALILAMKQRRYPGAELLDYRRVQRR
jgi:hypothetical protein